MDLNGFHILPSQRPRFHPRLFNTLMCWREHTRDLSRFTTTAEEIEIPDDIVIAMNVMRCYIASYIRTDNSTVPAGALWHA